MINGSVLLEDGHRDPESYIGAFRIASGEVFREVRGKLTEEELRQKAIATFGLKGHQLRSNDILEFEEGSLSLTVHILSLYLFACGVTPVEFFEAVRLRMESGTGLAASRVRLMNPGESLSEDAGKYYASNREHPGALLKVIRERRRCTQKQLLDRVWQLFGEFLAIPKIQVLSRFEYKGAGSLSIWVLASCLYVLAVDIVDYFRAVEGYRETGRFSLQF